MATGRNPVADCLALAALPGLEQMSAALTSGSSSVWGKHPESMLILLGARAAFGSLNAAASALRTTGLWEDMRASAARVGRVLPTRPPTENQWWHLRRRGGHELGGPLAEAFAESAIDVARAVGLLTPRSPRWHRPRRENVVYGDGSLIAGLSDVRVDPETGEVIGSRARFDGGGPGPRLGEVFIGKDGTAAGTGLPVAMVGCHGGMRWQRVVLGVDIYSDRNEVAAAMRLFEGLLARAQGTVHAVVYDGLLPGAGQQWLMRRGVVPIVPMAEAKERARFVTLPEELRQRRRSAGCAGKRDKAPKARLQVHPLEAAEHWTGMGLCVHRLYSIDGVLVALQGREEVSLDAPVAPQVDLRFEPRPGGMALIGTYRVPCRHGSFVHSIDLSANRTGRRSGGGQPAFVDVLRPIDPVEASYELAGYREDAESAFNTLQRALPHDRRASSLRPGDFLCDVVGVGLWMNAVAWDVHGAQHTPTGRENYAAVMRSEKAKRRRKRT